MTTKRNPMAGIGTYAERVAKQDKATRPDMRDRPMTYRIGDELIERVNQAADEYNVEKSSLVKAMLTYALDALDSGAWDLSVREKRRKLDS